MVVNLTADGALMSPATIRGLDALARSGADIMIVGRPEAVVAGAGLPEEYPGLTFLRPPPDHAAVV